MWSAAVLLPALPGRPEHPGQRFVGVVQPDQQRVIAKSVLEIRGSPLLLLSGR
jgi:hypothetical protein